MKDLAFGIVLVLAGLLLLLFTMIQAASKTLKLALIISVIMGLISSFIAAMVCFELDPDLPFDAIYKMMFFSQLASGVVSIMLTL